MKQSPVLSIIIPVYRVEKYIKKCLDSVFGQSAAKEDYEVIVVDDGSPDHSIDIVNQYISNDNIKIIRQSNQGLSAARNAGVAVSAGQYIWFVDSDDMVYGDSIERIIETIKRHWPDIIASLITEYDESDNILGTERYNNYLQPGAIVTGKNYLFNKGLVTPAQRFVYRRGFLDKYHLSFYPGILHEDLEFCPRALYLAETVYLMSQPLYYYLVRTVGNITASFGKRHAESLVKIYHNLVDFRTVVSNRDITTWRAYESFIIETLIYRAKKSLSMGENPELRKVIKDNLSLFKANYWHILFDKRKKAYRFKNSLIMLLPERSVMKYFFGH